MLSKVCAIYLIILNGPSIAYCYLCTSQPGHCYLPNLIIHSPCGFDKEWDGNKCVPKTTIEELLPCPPCRPCSDSTSSDFPTPTTSSDFPTPTTTKEIEIRPNRTLPPIQLDPNNPSIQIELCVGETQNILLKLKPKPKPLDIYILYSLGGGVDTKIEEEQANNFVKLVTETAPDVAVGLGTFVSKKNLTNDEDPAWSFRNEIPLTTSNLAMAFTKLAAIPTANIASKDSQLDALYQVAVCEEEVCWRAGSTRIVLLVADAPGDGGEGNEDKLKPFPDDMKCNLNGSGYYEGESEFSYPSEHQVAMVMKEATISMLVGIHHGTAFQNEFSLELQQRLGLAVGLPYHVQELKEGNFMEIVKSGLEVIYDSKGKSVSFIKPDGDNFAKFFIQCEGEEEKEALECYTYEEEVEWRIQVEAQCEDGNATEKVRGFTFESNGLNKTGVIKLHSTCDPDDCVVVD